MADRTFLDGSDRGNRLSIVGGTEPSIVFEVGSGFPGTDPFGPNRMSGDTPHVEQDDSQLILPGVGGDVQLPSDAADLVSAQDLGQFFTAAIENHKRRELVGEDNYTFGLTEPSFGIDQDDGARWDVYDHPTNPWMYTILTGEGRALHADPARRSELKTLLADYKLREQGIAPVPRPDSDLTMRTELGRGQEAIVYTMGQFAVREELGIKDLYVALGELTRMDAINTVIDSGLPRWLNLPAHYAFHADPVRQKTFTLMDRINGGVTVEDILEYPNPARVRKMAAVQKELGEGVSIEDVREQIERLYDEAYEILAQAISDAGKDPEDFLTDWEPRNVLIERLATPVAGADFSLNVIDQYRN